MKIWSSNENFQLHLNIIPINNILKIDFFSVVSDFMFPYYS